MTPSVKQQITKAKADLTRSPTRKMNKLEADYASRLDLLAQSGHIVEWRFEAVRLRLADGSYYKPDFMVIQIDGTICFHETKGHWREAARVRIKVAADLYWYFKFVAIKRAPGGRWAIEEF